MTIKLPVHKPNFKSFVYVCIIEKVFIIKTLNKVYVSLLGIIIFAYIACFKLCKDLSLESKTRIVFIIWAVLFIIFILYKYCLLNDEDYAKTLEALGRPRTDIFAELPLNPCNVFLLLLPIGILTNSKAILAFCFYGGSFLPILATLSPCAGFSDNSILKFRVFGFYFIHLAQAPLCMLVGLLGIYHIELSGILYSLFCSVVLIVFSYFCNLLIRKNHLSESVNYCYSYDHENIAVLKFFYDLLPFRCIYLIPLSLCYYLIFYIVFSIIL